MADLLAPTEGHEFISPQEAQWLAVDALFVSLARQLEFDEVFGGGLSKYYQVWLLEIAKKQGRTAGFTQLNKLKATERSRAVFDDPKNSVWRVIEEDLLPLRMVIEGVMSGASQKDAMERVSEALMRPDGFRTEFVNDPEFADAMPKTLRHSSVKRLEQLWRKYRSVFHYILIWHAGFLRTRAGHELEPVPDALRAFRKISSRIEASSRTKRLLLPEPTVLKFVSAADYAASMRDS
ncbi:hypothetical protein SAMN04488118_102193 [Epibacterium ulvae]|uniref:Uncharacterized protein n=1 Tax=Epibacterium ulvae TaxID=1156985 RepID=A0A1G5PWA2_9RHOB|nr:hypothetical protein [Epibacterium ulvae]SCZ53803.1 hypothetical protein SAMN04488118_102193 [Epibacterium ulvae]